MAKTKEKINKSQVIRDYRESHPDATPQGIAEVLTKHGIKVSAQFVSTVLSNAKKAGGTVAKRGPKPKADKSVAAPANGQLIVPSPTLPQLLSAMGDFVRQAGGIDNAHACLDALRHITA